jgi:hypothetical protein
MSVAATTDRCRELVRELAAAWGSDTSSDPAGWTAANAAWGQCAVTALLVQDKLGGDLLRCAAPGGSHYWNRLPDGSELDLTRHQFRTALHPHAVQVRERDYVLSFAETRRRYETLCRRVAASQLARTA